MGERQECIVCIPLALRRPACLSCSRAPSSLIRSRSLDPRDEVHCRARQPDMSGPQLRGRSGSTRRRLARCVVFASPHWGSIVVASDDGGQTDFHKGNPREKGTTDGSLSSTTICKLKPRTFSPFFSSRVSPSVITSVRSAGLRETLYLK